MIKLHIFCENQRKNLSKGGLLMLIAFSIANFMSIKEKQIFSFIGSSDKSLLESNTFDSGFGKNSRLLRSSVIYGANASGKTNIIRAFYFFQDFVRNSATSLQEGRPISTFKPFKFSATSLASPGEFEIIFIHEGVRYCYGFALTETRVTQEWLTAYPKGKPQKWFERLFDSSTQDYTWKIGEHFKGELSSWRALTRPNALFLSTAVQFNSKQLQPVFHWIDKNLIVIFPGIDFNGLLTLNMFDDERNRTRLLNFIQVADLGIEDFQVRKEETSIGLQTSTRVYKISALHKIGDSSELISLDLDQESMGTQKLFWLAGGWIKALQEGAVLLYDELSSSFHPHISRFLINQFHAPHTNRKNAQLIISTHDTNLLDENIFRRDQIWFTEKNHDQQSTKLYSLWDYSPRKGEAFEKGYLKGRYGALPFIGIPEL